MKNSQEMRSIEIEIHIECSIYLNFVFSAFHLSYYCARTNTWIRANSAYLISLQFIFCVYFWKHKKTNNFLGLLYSWNEQTCLQQNCFFFVGEKNIENRAHLKRLLNSWIVVYRHLMNKNIKAIALLHFQKKTTK